MTQYHYKIATTIGDADPDPFSESSTQLFSLGTELKYADRIYKYSGIGSASVTAGKLLQTKVAVANHRDIAVQTAASAGDTSVIVTLGSTAATANQYAEGYLHVNDVAGQGQLLKIKSHSAADASANLTLTLDDKLKTALSTSTKVDLISNIYNDLVVSTGGVGASTNTSKIETGPVVGVTTIDMTADYYGWIQVSGPCSVLYNHATLMAGVNSLGVGDTVYRNVGVAGSCGANMITCHNTALFKAAGSAPDSTNAVALDVDGGGSYEVLAIYSITDPGIQVGDLVTLHNYGQEGEGLVEETVKDILFDSDVAEINFSSGNPNAVNWGAVLTDSEDNDEGMITVKLLNRQQIGVCMVANGSTDNIVVNLNLY